MLQTVERLETVPLNQLGIEFDREFYLKRISKYRKQKTLGLETIANDIGKPLREARELVKRKEETYRGFGKQNGESLREVLARHRTEAEDDLSVEVFTPAARIKITVIDIIEASRASRSDRRMVKKLNSWQNFLDNQLEKESGIGDRVEFYRNILELNRNSDDTDDKGKRKNRANILTEALKEMRKEAPEEVLRSLLEPDTYRPRRKTTQRMLDLVEERRNKGSFKSSFQIYQLEEKPFDPIRPISDKAKLIVAEIRIDALEAEIASLKRQGELNLDTIRHYEWLLANAEVRVSGKKEEIEGSFRVVN